jgi:hypothetical protein
MIMAKHAAKPDPDKPDSQSIGNQDNSKRGRGKDPEQVANETKSKMGQPDKGTGKHGK